MEYEDVIKFIIGCLELPKLTNINKVLAHQIEKVYNEYQEALKHI